MRLSAAIAAFAFCLAGFSALAEGKASRLPDLPDPPTDPDLIKALEERKASGRQLINLQLKTMHAPKISAATGPLANVIRNEVAVPRLLIEIAIMRSAYVAGSEYELLQHQVLSKGCKYPQEKIDGIAQWHTSKAYDEKERALLAYTDQMTNGGDVDDATYAKFASFFTPREIVELTVTIAQYYGNGLLTRALRIKLETGGRVTSQGKC